MALEQTVSPGAQCPRDRIVPAKPVAEPSAADGDGSARSGQANPTAFPRRRARSLRVRGSGIAQKKDERQADGHGQAGAEENGIESIGITHETKQKG